MQRLQQLIEKMDTAANDSIKITALKSYFKSTPPEDAAWALFFMEEKRLPTKTGIRLLKELVATLTCLPSWMLGECNERVNDFPETIALSMPWNGRTCDLPLSTLVIQFLQPLAGFSQRARRETILCAWEILNTSQRILFNKMLTGTLQVGVSKVHIHDALAQMAGIPLSVMSRRLAEDWTPSATWFLDLIKPAPEKDQAMAAYQLHQARNLEGHPERLGESDHWIAEWALEGARIQLTKRKHVISIWSVTNEPLNTCFPELVKAAELLPEGTVLDGVIVGWIDEQPASSDILYARLRSKKTTQKTIQSNPIQFITQDILEHHGSDLRNRPLDERSRALKNVMEEWSQQWVLVGATQQRERINPDFFQQEMFGMDEVLSPSTEKEVLPQPMRKSETIHIPNWSELERHLKECRDRKAAGILLKRSDSSYPTKADDSSWLIWEPPPFTANLILVSAQRDPGKPNGHFIGYGFAAWHDGELVPIAKTNEGLSEADRTELNTFIDVNTKTKQGPIHRVKPEKCMQIAYHDIQKSSRSASGIRLGKPRIMAHLPHLPPEQAYELKQILDSM